ncbi:aspartic peptidase domain-containing protein [Desarmillaria tabescens]|uniref:Aspartic peptidase domain-containing protein n=1 Tax=Armillaria tabescens TaxID=1929756 RepID=A0AA39KCR5_ARMTA|nr:aspartic peptidase domain-containing protein [Desarmillaria tabescens]KAK0457419.1 aspartic peptidase domain-containing protein [Desarmillaria tabescens]
MYSLFSLCWLLITPVSFAAVIPGRVEFLPQDVTNIPGGFDLPILRSRRGTVGKRGDISGSVGLGDNSDLLYTVPIELGDDATAVHLDTGSSDLWVITDACTGGTCASVTTARYDSSTLNLTGAQVTMNYGDSTTGTSASGPIAFETATIAGISITGQTFVAVNTTTNPTVKYGAAGIFGLGFPSGSKVQEAVVENTFGSVATTDDFVLATSDDGPLLSRIAMTNSLQAPMFSISLQRDTIDIGGGDGTLTVGKLPDGIDNSSLTWVPVRLYSASEGGLRPPSFAPDEVYPFRWEVDIDGVYLDGQKIADSTIAATDGVDGTRVSALIDTGNSLLRGPSDVVKNILSTVSSSYDASDANSQAVIPCATAHTLSFQIGGKMFPIDPRDFIGDLSSGDATNCVADNLVSTDPPGLGSLYRWSLGDPFFKSNLVAFHYGNLTHPSVDPPRVGILSMVPDNADSLLQQAVQDAEANGGNFESTIELAPTAEAATASQVTVSLGESATGTLVSASGIASVAATGTNTASSSDNSSDASTKQDNAAMVIGKDSRECLFILVTVAIVLLF